MNDITSVTAVHIIIHGDWMAKRIQTIRYLNKGQSNLAKGDGQYLLSYSLGGSTRREVGPCDEFGTPISGEGEVVGGQRWYHLKERLWLSIVTIALSLTIRPQFAIECLRRSNQQGWQNIGRKGLTYVSQILTRCGRDMGLLYAKDIVSVSFSVLSTMHERDRQRPQDGFAIGEIACQ